MHRQHPFDAFQFDDQAFFDDEIDAERGSEFDALVNDGQVNLVLEVQSGLFELVVQTGIASALEHTGAERGMNLDGSSYHQRADCVRFHE